MKFLSIHRIKAALTMLFAAALLYSCQKSNNPEPEPLTEEESTQFSSEAMEADASYDDIQDVAMTAAGEEELEAQGRGNDGVRVYVFAYLRLRIGQCANISVSPDDGTYPKTVTIDFGNGCRGADGKWRKGKIVLHYTGPIRQSGSVLTITLVDFQLNRAKIEGTKVITNMSAGGNIQYTVQVTDGKVTFPNARGYAYEKLKYVKQVAGGATDELRDDVYEIEGRSETSFNSGVKVVLNTEDALVKKLACPWVSDGSLKIKINENILFLNYGFPNNGDCDNKAMLSWNGGQGQLIINLP